VHGAREATGYGSIGGFGRVPWALGGGSPGTENFLDYTTTDLRIRRGRVPRVRLGDGAVVSSVTGTGGGFGDPFEREPERVCEDVLDGYVTADEARATYGVAFDPVSLRPDAAETARLRAR
jgi:N-methylhydantoinase B